MEHVNPARGELIVVDNNSTDRTATVAAQAGATVVFEPHNQISRARNRGAQAATGPAILFIDADTVITPVLLEQALLALGNGACGGGTTIGTSDAVSPSIRVALGTWNWLAPHLGWAAGAFVFCLRRAWEDVGGFREDLYASEELHFSRMIAKWGKKEGLRFRILREPIDTSMRKAQWYRPARLLAMMIMLGMAPWLLKQRKWCGIWYKRPD